MGAPFSNETTSLAAAQSLDPDRLGAMERSVLEVIASACERGKAGLTSEQVCATTGLRTQTATARIRGLVLRGRLKDSGDRAPTSSGRMAILWRITSIGDQPPSPQTHGRIVAALIRERQRFAKLVRAVAVDAPEGGSMSMALGWRNACSELERRLAEWSVDV